MSSSILSIGIIGLPNVGKSTIFNALVETAQAESSNYPFCTIEPNVGIVEVPDERLKKLAEIEKSEKIIPAAIKFVDIAGLVKGASKGEGLGNKFLSHIKEVDAVAHVVRCFPDPKITHVAGRVDPAEDIKIINLELILADLEQVDRAIERIQKELKGSKKEMGVQHVMSILQKIKENLEKEVPIRDIRDLTAKDLELIKDIQLITKKPIFYIINISEEQLQKGITDFDLSKDSVLICAKTEEELKQLSLEDRKEYLESLGVVGADHDLPLQQVIKKGYEILDLISFFTTGPKESRAWTIKKGTKAPEAGGRIHSDFEKKFIAAEVISYDKFIEAEGWTAAREKGWIRTEGKEYEIKDGEVVLFKHG